MIQGQRGNGSRTEREWFKDREGMVQGQREGLVQGQRGNGSGTNINLEAHIYHCHMYVSSVFADTQTENTPGYTLHQGTHYTRGHAHYIDSLHHRKYSCPS